VTAIALVQLGGNIDKAVNLDKIERLTTEAAAAGARIICLPELCTTTYFCTERDPRHRQLAEPIPGPAFTRASALAARLGVVLVFPLYERAATALYNTAAVIGPDGQLMGKYRKNSLSNIPRSEKSGDTSSHEAFYFEQGDLGFPVFDTPFGLRLGILICYDRHFPEAARVLAMQGAHVILVPTCSSRGWMRDVWEVELRAHAVMNTVFVGGVNKVGIDVGGSRERLHFGSSVFVGPRGEVLASASADRDEWIQADVDAALVEEQRDHLGAFRERRPEAYRLLTEAHGEGPTVDSTFESPGHEDSTSRTGS
jgi:N-carbamoylputrescine amidase